MTDIRLPEDLQNALNTLREEAFRIIQTIHNKAKNPDSASTQKIIDFLRNCDNRPLAEGDPTSDNSRAVSFGRSLIYHYTNESGLRDILKSKTLWLSDIKNLNDTSELNHGVSLATTILRSKVENRSLNHQAFAKFSNNAFGPSGAQNTAYYFVCSFSTKGNDLEQWRNYADDGRGYILGFNKYHLEKTFTNDGGTRAFETLYYDSQELETIYTPFIEKILDAIPNIDDAILMGLNTLPETREFLTKISVELASFMLEASLYFKHPAYLNEKEYRFLKICKHNASQVKTRYRPYELIKYTELNWEGTLQSIMVGPAANQPKAKRFAEDCLAEFDITGVTVDCSDIPYRSHE